MSTVFADANFWIALLNRRDQHHDIAKKAEARLEPETRFVTTEMVLAEVLNTFAELELGQLKDCAARFVLRLRNQPNTNIIPQTSDQFESAFEIYRGYKDKHWSLTDCASYRTMKTSGIELALTYDHHFVQMGFVALLRERAM